MFARVQASAQLGSRGGAVSELSSEEVQAVATIIGLSRDRVRADQAASENAEKMLPADSVAEQNRTELKLFADNHSNLSTAKLTILPNKSSMLMLTDNTHVIHRNQILRIVTVGGNATNLGGTPDQYFAARFED